MLLFVERAAQSMRLDPVVHDPAKKEHSAIALSFGPAYPLDETLAETQMYTLTGPLFFASSEKALSKLMREVTAGTLALDLSRAGLIDSAATDYLRKIAERQWRRGGELRLIGLDESLSASINNKIPGFPGSAGELACQSPDESATAERNQAAQARTHALPGKQANLNLYSSSGGK